jgi:hypothetical protein
MGMRAISPQQSAKSKKNINTKVLTYLLIARPGGTQDDSYSLRGVPPEPSEDTQNGNGSHKRDCRKGCPGSFMEGNFL